MEVGTSGQESPEQREQQLELAKKGNGYEGNEKSVTNVGNVLTIEFIDRQIHVFSSNHSIALKYGSLSLKFYSAETVKSSC